MYVDFFGTYYFKFKDKNIIHISFPSYSLLIEKKDNGEKKEKDNRKPPFVLTPYHSSWLQPGSREIMEDMKEEVGPKNENTAEDLLSDDSYP